MNQDDYLDAPMEANLRREDEFHAAVERYVADHRDELLAALRADVGLGFILVLKPGELESELRDLAAPIVDRLFQDPIEKEE